MKVVRIDSGEVREVIPDYALPVEKWYGEEFAAQCVEAPDEVDQRWVYDSKTGTFSQPVEPEPGPEYTEMQIVQQDITDLQLSDIEQGQAITDLELIILEGGQKNV